MFVPGSPFQSSEMFVAKAGSSQMIGTSGLNCKHYTRLQRPAKDKHSSLFGLLISCRVLFCKYGLWCASCKTLVFVSSKHNNLSLTFVSK
jgi:hypothetical protein